MKFLRDHGRYIVATIALAIAFVLSVQFSDRGVEFDLRNTAWSASDAGADYDLSSLKILNRVLLQVKDNYVEPERIDPNKMLVYALDEIQNSIPEVVVAFDKDRDAHPNAAEVFVNDKSKKFEIGKIESLWEMSFRLKEIFTFVQQHLKPTDDLKYQDVEYAAINGMLSTLDPHSTLLPPQNYEDMQTQTGGKFGGLGIVISVRDGLLTVISPIDGTPAAKKGLKSMDRITRIGEESTINMSVSDAVNMLRGEPGTDVELWISRKGWEEPRKFSITRAIIKIDSVESQALSNKVGYVRIKNFQANTFSDLKKQLDDLKTKMGGINGLVMDLRDNPGGLLDQAIRISDLFLDSGVIVSTVSAGNVVRERREAHSAGTEPKYPIIILVNAGSASASEIVSGALQNHDRAVVLGDTSFGKGSVQVLTPFPDESALKLTVAQYLTPGGISIQSTGIVPDFHTTPMIITKDDVDMFPSANVIREGNLSSHLTNTNVKKVQDGGYTINFFDKELSEKIAKMQRDKDNDEEPEIEDDKFKEDFDIRLAQRLITKAGTTWNRKELKTKLVPELDAAAKAENEAVTKELKKLGIDWSEGTSPKSPKLAVQFKTSAAGDVKAGDKFKLELTVTNNSDKPVYRLKAISESDNGALDDREFLIGKLNPGQSRSWSSDVSLPRDLPSRHDMISLKFSDDTTIFDTKGELAINIEGSPLPQFAFSYDVLDASGDGRLALNENAKLRIMVKNVGRADSDETLVFLKNLASEAVYLKTGREKIPSIKVGAEVPVEFEFHVKTAPKNGIVDLEVDVYDTTFRQLTAKKFTVPFVEKDAKVSALKGTATVTTGPAKVFTGASTAAEVAAVANSKATLPVTGKIDGWLKVDLAGRSGWVQDNAVTFKDSAGTLEGLKRAVMYQPPSIELKPASFVTSSTNIGLKGTASDDSGVKDYYIYVYNRDNAQLNSRKLKYVRTSGDKVKIDANVPLFKGMNRIAVVARDEEGMTTTESTYVFRR
ncbi:MAG: MXAN_5808 family serine peptidase [bacterium]